MKRVSYRYLAFSSLAALKKVFADSDIKLLDILFWVKMAVNSVVAKTLTGKPPTGSYLATFTNVPVIYNNKDNGSLLFRKKYLSLPANIFDLPLDNAIDWMNFRNPSFIPNCGCKEHFTFQRSTLVQIKLMYDTAFEKPGIEDNFYFVRVNDLLYLFGIEDVQVKAVDMAIRTSVSPYISSMTLDDEVMLNDEQVLDVISKVVSIGRYVMMVPKERVEDGTDTTATPPGRVIQPEQTAGIGQ
jgi:hypothetical protein